MTAAERLHCAEAHVASVRRMVEAGAPCSAVLLQIRAVRGSLRAVVHLLIEAGLRDAMREGGVSDAARLAERVGEALLTDARRE